MTSLDRSGALRPVDRSVRLARSAAAALVCVIAAATGHLAAGGPLPPGAVVVTFSASAAAAWLLSARRILPTQLLGLLVLCQVGVHLAASSEHMVMGAGMIGAHGVATLVSLAVLSFGEAFVWHVVERLGLRLRPLLHVLVIVPTLRPPLAVVVERCLRDVRLAYSRSLRGPPVGLV